jgi:subtilase-type serine protease
MSLAHSTSVVALVAAMTTAGGAALAQTVNTTPAAVNDINLLSPFLSLNSTPVGRATLQTSLQRAVSINSNATLAQQQLSISDEAGTTGGSNLAGGSPAQAPVNGITPQQPVGGYGSLLGPIYVKGVAGGAASPLANTVNLITVMSGLFGGQSGVAKNYFANGAASNPSVRTIHPFPRWLRPATRFRLSTVCRIRRTASTTWHME